VTRSASVAYSPRMRLARLLLIAPFVFLWGCPEAPTCVDFDGDGEYAIDCSAGKVAICGDDPDALYNQSSGALRPVDERSADGSCGDDVENCRPRPVCNSEGEVVCPGGENGRSMVAYHKDTGEMVWAGGNDRAGYSSPTLRTVAGVDQILIFNNSHVAAHHPHTGAVLWKFPWPGQTQRVAQPLVVAPSQVFVTSGYGAGSKLLQIEEDASGALQASVVWENNRLKSKFANVVYRGGFVYGLDDGILVCLDIHDGKRQWKRGRYGHGQMMLVDDLLLIVTERGDLALVEASPDVYREIAYMPAIEGKTWNNPALAGAYLLVRNSQEAAGFKLQVRHELSHAAAALK